MRSARTPTSFCRTSLVNRRRCTQGTWKGMSKASEALMQAGTVRRCRASRSKRQVGPITGRCGFRDASIGGDTLIVGFRGRASRTCGCGRPSTTLASSEEISVNVRYNCDMSDTPSTPQQVPKVYRAMKSSPKDNLPMTGSGSSSELGVRVGIDIAVDDDGHVVLNGNGMSVAPAWRDLPFTRIPKRLRNSVPGAAGANSTFCFAMGIGPFQRGVVADGLELIPDAGTLPITHGVVAPIRAVAIKQYQFDLESTRAAWQIDEA